MDPFKANPEDAEAAEQLLRDQQLLMMIWMGWIDIKCLTPGLRSQLRAMTQSPPGGGGRTRPRGRDSDGPAELDGSFLAGVLVETEDGPVPVEEVAVGTFVLSRDALTGEVDYQRVVRTYEGEAFWVVHLRVSDKPAASAERQEQPSSGSDTAEIGQTIRCTTSHPFWVEDLGWVRAGHLRSGHVLLGSGGEALVILEQRIEPEAISH